MNNSQIKLLKILFLLISFASFSTKSQISENPFIGTWEMKGMSVYNKKDSVAEKMMTKMMEGQLYHFNDSLFQMKWHSKIESGYYHFNDKDSSMLMTQFNFPTGKKMKIMKSTKDTFMLEMEGKGMLIYVLKSSKRPMIKTVSKLKMVEISKKQLCQTWVIVPYKSSSSDTLVARIADEIKDKLFEGTARKFQFDGSYIQSSKLQTFDGEGTWEFGPDKKSIIIDKGSWLERRLRVISVTKSKLTLLDHQNKKWIYLLKE
ncbi:MAG: hypothetical protein ACJA0Q_000597 [Saprospiraceae bacterium]|jgi:hypothetical protein